MKPPAYRDHPEDLWKVCIIHNANCIFDCSDNVWKQRCSRKQGPLCNEDVDLVLQRIICFPSSFPSGLCWEAVHSLFVCAMGKNYPLTLINITILISFIIINLCWWSNYQRTEKWLWGFTFLKCTLFLCVGNQQTNKYFFLVEKKSLLAYGSVSIYRSHGKLCKKWKTEAYWLDTVIEICFMWFTETITWTSDGF